MNIINFFLFYNQKNYSGFVSESILSLMREMASPNDLNEPYASIGSKSILVLNLPADISCFIEFTPYKLSILVFVKKSKNMYCR